MVDLIVSESANNFIDVARRKEGSVPGITGASRTVAGCFVVGQREQVSAWHD